MQEIIIIAGPNGAGKTSFANQYLRGADNPRAFVNADEIAREIAAAGTGDAVDLNAAREMLRRIDALAAAQAAFMFETTLASLTYARKIAKWRQRGYHVSLIYLRLPSVEASLARVRRRVEAGGHSIPDSVVRQRFSKSLQYLDGLYKPAVDEWYIWDSLEGEFRLAQSWDDQ